MIDQLPACSIQQHWCMSVRCATAEQTHWQLCLHYSRWQCAIACTELKQLQLCPNCCRPLTVSVLRRLLKVSVLRRALMVCLHGNMQATCGCICLHRTGPACYAQHRRHCSRGHSPNVSATSLLLSSSGAMMSPKPHMHLHTVCHLYTVGLRNRQLQHY